MVITWTTDDVYHGLFAVRAKTFDRLGNNWGRPFYAAKVFVNTGPQPPTNPKFDSQTGSGPLTFSFTQSPELMT